MKDDNIDIRGIKLTKGQAMAIVRFIIIIGVTIFYNYPPETIREDNIITYSNSPFLYGFHTMCIFIIITQVIKIFEDLIYNNEKVSK